MQELPVFCVLYIEFKKRKEEEKMRASAKKIDISKQEYLVKLRIDKRTIIMVRNEQSLKNWKAKYPDAVIVM